MSKTFSSQLHYAKLPPSHSSAIQFLQLFFFFEVYLFMAILGLGCFDRVSLAVVSGGYSVGAVLGLLIAAVSPVAEHRL